MSASGFSTRSTNPFAITGPRSGAGGRSSLPYSVPARTGAPSAAPAAVTAARTPTMPTEKPRRMGLDHRKEPHSRRQAAPARTAGGRKVRPVLHSRVRRRNPARERPITRAMLGPRPGPLAVAIAAAVGIAAATRLHPLRPLGVAPWSRWALVAAVIAVCGYRAHRSRRRPATAAPDRSRWLWLVAAAALGLARGGRAPV